MLNFKVVVVVLAIIFINIRSEISATSSRNVHDEVGNVTVKELTKDGGPEAGEEAGAKVGPETGNETDREIDNESGEEDIEEEVEQITTRTGSLSGIVNNAKANRGDIPYQAAIFYNRSNGLAYLCGGSLISPQWVLTAAHCVNESSQWHVKLGSISRERGVRYRGERYLLCKHGVYPKEYGRFRFQHDIGLIKLPSRLKPTRYIHPIRLPRSHDSHKTLVDEDVRVSGWGKVSPSKQATYLSTDLMFTDLVTIRNAECETYYSSVYEHTICARGLHRGGACQGDSGGPLTFKESDGERTQVGIFVFVHSSGCYPKYPSGYTRVGYYLQWIKKHTGLRIRQ